MSPRGRTTSCKKVVKWILIFLLIGFLCFHFQDFLNKKTQAKVAYKLLQEYMSTGLLQLAPSRPLNCQHKNVFLLVLVPSAISNFEQRLAIRKTWGNVTTTEPKVLLRFVLGKNTNTGLQRLAETENSIYNDIIFENISEAYENLSKKSIAMLRWASLHCPGVQYLLKIDDDMFLNLPRLLSDLRKRPKLNSISGCKVRESSPFRSFSKWKISREQYEEDIYPDYISGTAYLISGDIVSKLNNATKHVPYFIFEDVYITGLCRRHIGAAALEHKEFSCGYREKGPCGKNFRYHITGHHYTPEEMKRMWSELQDRWSNCRFVDSFLIYHFMDVIKQLMFFFKAWVWDLII